MKLVQDLTEENSRLIRDNKRANASLDSMVKDIAELNNRLFDIALQSPDDGGDIFDDTFADPAEVAERAEKKKKEAAAAASGGSSDAGAGRALGGMDSAMKKRQEETAAEVGLCCWFQYLSCTIFYLSMKGSPLFSGYVVAVHQSCVTCTLYAVNAHAG